MGLFNLAKIVVLALHKELERSGKAQVQEVVGYAAEDQRKSELLTRKYTIQDQSKWSFTVMIDLYSLTRFGEE